MGALSEVDIRACEPAKPETLSPGDCVVAAASNRFPSSSMAMSPKSPPYKLDWSGTASPNRMIRDHEPLPLPAGRYAIYSRRVGDFDGAGRLERLDRSHILPMGIARAGPDVTDHDGFVIALRRFPSMAIANTRSTTGGVRL